MAGQSTSPRIRCREVEDADTEAIAQLLAKSEFAGPKEFWTWCLQRLTKHPTPAGYPKYGILLEVNDIPVGVLLTIITQNFDTGAIKCNVSSWFIWPAFSIYGSLLARCVLSYPDVTYFNISPLPHTFRSLIAQGYTLYCHGRYVAVPALCLGPARTRVEEANRLLRPGSGLSAGEVKLLADHAAYGCLCIVVTVAGERHPFVFQVGRKRRIIRFAYLVYCRDMQNFIDLAGPIGRFLAKRAIFLAVIDANGPVRGLIGRYRKSTPKYFKGPNPPQLGDVTYSERVLFNLG